MAGQSTAWPAQAFHWVSSGHRACCCECQLRAKSGWARGLQYARNDLVSGHRRQSSAHPLTCTRRYRLVGPTVGSAGTPTTASPEVKRSVSFRPAGRVTGQKRDASFRIVPRIRFEPQEQIQGTSSAGFRSIARGPSRSRAFRPCRPSARSDTQSSPSLICSWFSLAPSL